MRQEIEFDCEDASRIPFMLRWVEQMTRKGLSGGEPVVCRLGRRRRNLEQNKKMWAVLTDIAKQVEWYGRYLKKEDWKAILSASLKGQQAVPGIDGGFVVLGESTSRMPKKEFSDLIELAHAFGGEHGVVWGKPAARVFDEYREAA